MLVSDKEKILQLIPQKPPFVMVDKLMEVGEKTAVTLFTITKDNVLVDNGRFTEAGLIENIAQSAALKMGYTCSLKGEKMPQGFIGDVKSLEIAYLPQAGTSISTRITEEHEIFDTVVIKGEIFQDEKIVASCRMKIFIPKAEK